MSLNYGKERYLISINWQSTRTFLFLKFLWLSALISFIEIEQKLQTSKMMHKLIYVSIYADNKRKPNELSR